ncbi:MAG: LOG family protein [Candidatus Binataceae bacterium]|jgi:uncharacterized protein (TIGR00730 family)
MANNSSKRGASEIGKASGRSRNRAAIAGSRGSADDTAGKLIGNDRPLISVFGSSRAREGDELYTEALWMGRLLGKSGFDVVTGGYAGVMEAVSRGAHETGAHVKGITLKSFGETVNPYVLDEITVPDFHARLRRLVDLVDGYVVMRGGMGTLAELTFTWQKLWLKMLPARPCILVGRRWQRVLDSWLRNLTVETSDYKCLTVAETPERACAILNAHFGRENASAIK